MLLIQGLKMLEDAKAHPKVWSVLWRNFGWHIKRGVYEDPTKRAVTHLLCYNTTRSPDTLVFLDDYVDNMCYKQDRIYFSSTRSEGLMINGKICFKMFAILPAC